ncbi:annexin A3a [Synchiropus splendidus]|uniref:annexin A3a n=1 Tax=Synchiropus splendidus TaxID=270530 RepID=UPI00237EC113|nr:annexin A3a [Synchiropus splendidus]
MASVWNDLEGLLEAPSASDGGRSTRGSIKPPSNFNPEEDAADLRKALKGLGTDEKTLVQILTQRSNAQRQVICQAYRCQYDQSLLDDVKGDTGGDLGDMLVALLCPPAVYDCHEVIKAMEGAGTEEGVLMEIFSSRTNAQIRALADVHLEETGTALTHRLKKEVSGEFSDALLILAQAERDESGHLNTEQAMEDAQVLYEAGEKKWGTDESKFIEILCRRSVAQLRRTLLEYKNLSGKTLQESIESEMSGDLQELLVSVVKCVKNPGAYFAERLRQSMKGGGTCEASLIRIMVSRSEVDMLDIRAQFKRLYEHSLHSAIESDLSGDLQDGVLALCGGDDD